MTMISSSAQCDAVEERIAHQHAHSFSRPEIRDRLRRRR